MPRLPVVIGSTREDFPTGPAQGRQPGKTVRLPTREDLGPRPSFRSQRGVFPFRADIGQAAKSKATAEAFGVVQDVLDAKAKSLERFAAEDAAREAQQLDTEYSDGIRALQLGDETPENLGYLNLRGDAAVQASRGHTEALAKFDAGKGVERPGSRPCEPGVQWPSPIRAG